jgi:lysophospholipase L1-like esterase
LSQFGAGVGLLAERITRTGARLILLPPTVIEEDPQSEGNRRLGVYRTAVRDAAHTYNALIAPTDVDFDIALAAGKAADPHFSLTTDGVHLRPAGDAVVALAVLKTLHFFDALV